MGNGLRVVVALLLNTMSQILGPKIVTYREAIKFQRAQDLSCTILSIRNITGVSCTDGFLRLEKPELPGCQAYSLSAYIPPSVHNIAIQKMVIKVSNSVCDLPKA